MSQSGILHIADESGKGCRHCDARWYNDAGDKGLVVSPGTRIEHIGPGVGGVGQTTWHPLSDTAASEAEPCKGMGLGDFFNSMRHGES